MTKKMDCNIDWNRVGCTAIGRRMTWMPAVVVVLFCYLPFPFLMFQPMIISIVVIALEWNNIVLRAHGIQGFLINLIWLVGDVVTLVFGPVWIIWNIICIFDVLFTMA